MAWPKASSAWRAWRLRALLHVRGDARQHLAGLIGLATWSTPPLRKAATTCSVSVSPVMKTMRNAGGGRIGLEAARHLEAVHARHHGVEQDHVGLACARAAAPLAVTATSTV